jgi:transposase-like protein
MLPSTEFKSLIDVVTRFPDEKSCHQYLASRRWSDGVMLCPHEGCGGDKAYVYKDGIRYKCKKCKCNYKATTGTYMEGTHAKATKWFLALYLIMHNTGITSVQLSKDIGVQQKTAWFMLQRIRAMFGHVDEEQQLTGTVQLDETFVGGKNKNRHKDKKVEKCQGRSFKDKTPVMGMLQQEVKEIILRPHKVIAGKMVKEKVIIEPSFLKCKVIKNTSGGVLKPIIESSVTAGSTLISDEWGGYNSVSGFTRYIVDHSRHEYVNAEGFTTNALEGSWTKLKNVIRGSYIRPSRKHLHLYVNEFVFRYNNRTLKVQPKFDKVILSMKGRLMYKDLVA